ncbi:hypothetical protein BsWGS_26825 [Bradybaena similaris]
MDLAMKTAGHRSCREHCQQFLPLQCQQIGHIIKQHSSPVMTTAFRSYNENTKRSCHKWKQHSGPAMKALLILFYYQAHTGPANKETTCRSCQHKNNMQVLPTQKQHAGPANTKTTCRSCQHKNNMQVLPTLKQHAGPANTKTTCRSCQHKNTMQVLPTHKQHAGPASTETACLS